MYKIYNQPKLTSLEHLQKIPNTRHTLTTNRFDEKPGVWIHLLGYLLPLRSYTNYPTSFIARFLLVG